MVLAELGVATSNLLPIAGYVGITCGVAAAYVAFDLAAERLTRAIAAQMKEQHMGLSARERQALHSIEAGLAESDPGLAAKLASLTQLMAGEAKPAAGQSRVSWPRRVIIALVCWLRGSRGRDRNRTLPRRGPAILAIWLVISGALIVTAATLSHVTAGGPCSPLSVSCDSRSPASPAQPGTR